VRDERDDLDAGVSRDRTGLAFRWAVASPGSVVLRRVERRTPLPRPAGWTRSGDRERPRRWAEGAAMGPAARSTVTNNGGLSSSSGRQLFTDRPGRRITPPAASRSSIPCPGNSTAYGRVRGRPAGGGCGPKISSSAAEGRLLFTGSARRRASATPDRGASITRRPLAFDPRGDLSAGAAERDRALARRSGRLYVVESARCGAAGRFSLSATGPEWVRNLPVRFADEKGRVGGTERGPVSAVTDVRSPASTRRPPYALRRHPGRGLATLWPRTGGRGAQYVLPT